MTRTSASPARTCELCREGPVDSTWWRRLPRHETMRLCSNCTARLVAQANDRGSTPQDALRLASIFATLSGEVWAVGDIVYWFRDPFFYLTALTEIGRPRAALA